MTRISRIVSDLGIAALAVAASNCAPADTRPTTVAIPDLAGRTAGAPQRCVPTQPTEALRVVDSHTVVYGSGGTIWLNRLATECPGMTRMDILVIEPMGTQYCRGDKVRSVDPVSHIPGPTCVLGAFVPYTR